MTKWEYRLVDFNVSDSNFLYEIEARGQEGWEIVTLNILGTSIAAGATTTALFKRRVHDIIE